MMKIKLITKRVHNTLFSIKNRNVSEQPHQIQKNKKII